MRGNALNQEYSVSLFDVLGKRILVQNKPEFIDASRLKPGVYFLKVDIGDATLKKKIIVQ